MQRHAQLQVPDHVVVVKRERIRCCVMVRSAHVVEDSLVGVSRIGFGTSQLYKVVLPALVHGILDDADVRLGLATWGFRTSKSAEQMRGMHSDDMLDEGEDAGKTAADQSN